MPQRQDDFSSSTVRFLGDQVNHRCSNPNCGAPTMGPGDPGHISNLGVAAHINAASPRGPRYEERQTSEQRKHSDNGIHLCQSCGKLVDDALSIHTVNQLQTWKADALQLARRALYMRDIDPDGRAKLRRETNHKTAQDLLRKLIIARRLIIEGTRIANDMHNTDPHMDRWREIDVSLKKWSAQAIESRTCLRDLLVDLRVVWGQPAVADEVVHMTFYLDRWRRMCVYKFLDLEGVDYEPELEPEENERKKWDWKLAFNGNDLHSKLFADAINEIVERAESSVAPFIASRGPA